MRKLLFLLTILFMGVTLNAQGHWRDDDDDGWTWDVGDALVSVQNTGGTLTSTAKGGGLFISEVADPGDNSSARFVELYNATSSDIDLGAGNYYLSRQSNGGSTWGDIQLTGTIAAGATYVIAYDSTEFNNAYGFYPNFDSGNINGNGDDGYFLYVNGDHTSGTLVDAYGVIDEDGTGKDWEYTDKDAVRNPNITNPNTTWTASEWTITSANAADCTPGQHTVSTASPTKLLVTASPLTSYDGKTTLTITAVDDNGSPANVSADVAITLTQNGTGTLAPTTATIASGTATVDVAVTYDVNETVTITATGDVNADGTNETATVDVDFKEALINVFPYTRDFDANQDINLDGWAVKNTAGTVAWTVSSYSGNYFLKFDASEVATSYYVSPKIQPTADLTDPVLSFNYTSNNVGHPLKVVYSVDYNGDPATATWTDLFSVQEDYNWAWQYSGSISLSDAAAAAANANGYFYIAFVVENTDDLQSTYEFDDIYIGNSLLKVLNAYSIDNNKVQVVMSNNIPNDGSVTADMFTLNGTAAESIDIDPNGSAIATLTFTDAAAVDNTLDKLVFDNNGETSEVDFYAGILPISMFNPASGTVIDEGYNATVSATVVYVSGRSTIIYDGTGDFSAIEVYDENFADNVVPGDSVILTGMSKIYYGYPEITPAVYYGKVGTGTLTATAIDLDPVTFVGTDAVTDDGAKYIGKLVTVSNVVADAFNSDGHNFWDAVVNTNGDKIWFDDRFYGSAFDGSEMISGKKYNVTGFVAYSWNRYIINPRSADDIQEVVAAGVNDVNSSVKVYPNPATDYIMLSTQANQVDIYSTTGQLIKSVQNTNRVDVSSLQAGTYMARIYTDEGMVVKPFIKK